MAKQQAKRFDLLQGQKANSNTQYVDALQINVSGIVMPIMGSDGFMQEEPGLTQYAEGEGICRIVLSGGAEGVTAI